jgi:hypothetical protein
MPAKRALFLVILCGSVVLAAEPPELRPLKGEKFKGDLVTLNDKEIVMQVGGKSVATPVEGVLQLDFRAPGSPTGDYTQVELADGSVLRCSKVEFKDKDATLTLTTGQTATVALPLIRTSWKELFGGKKKAYDILVAKVKDSLQWKEGTLYDATADGKSLNFTYTDGTKKVIPAEEVHGMILNRPPDPNMPSRRCEVTDTQGAKLFAKSVALKGEKLVVETQCGAKVEYALDAVARLDYSKGKLTYLSDIELARVKVDHRGKLLQELPKRDTNLDGQGAKIKIAGTTYPKGLALRDYTAMTFDLDGEYREFKAVVGVDDNVDQGNPAPVVLKIEGDGKELLTLSITRKDGAKPVALNIKDVSKLKIIVSASDENRFGLGSHLDIADAQVSK